MNWAQTWRIAEPLSLAEVGDRLVIRRQPADQPHHFHIAPGLPLEPTARLNPVEIAVDVELQQIARMIGRPAGRQRRDPVKAETPKIELIDEDVDRPNRVVVADPVFQALGKQRALAGSTPSTKRFIRPSKHKRIVFSLAIINLDQNQRHEKAQSMTLNNDTKSCQRPHAEHAIYAAHWPPRSKRDGTLFKVPSSRPAVAGAWEAWRLRAFPTSVRRMKTDNTIAGAAATFAFTHGWVIKETLAEAASRSRCPPRRGGVSARRSRSRARSR